MTTFLFFLSPRAAEAIGSALLHSIWQGLIIACLLAVTLRYFRATLPQFRYALCTAAFALLAILPVATATQIYISLDAQRTASNLLFNSDSPSFAVPPPSSLSADTADSMTPAHPSRVNMARIRGMFAAWHPVLAFLWMVGVVFFAIRLAGGLFVVAHLKRNSTLLDDPFINALVKKLSAQIGLKPTVHVHSSQIDQPMLIGWLKPVIILPISLLSGFTPEQVEAILAHELAHVRRHDYLISLFQSTVETLLFYHPAVWWISAQIRVERERCCDDVAVEMIADRIRYVQTLARLEAVRTSSVKPALGAGDGRLVDRIRRLVDLQKPRKNPRPYTTAWAPIFIVLLGGGLSLAACATDTLDLDNSSPEVLYEAGVASFQKKDVFQAKQYLRKAAEAGNVCAMQVLSEMLYPIKTFTNENILENAVTWAQSDEEESMYWGEQFVQLLRQEADNGNAEAMIWLSRAYHTRWHLPRPFSPIQENDSLALDWQKRAIATGSPIALRESTWLQLEALEQSEVMKRLQNAALNGDDYAFYLWSSHNAADPAAFFKIADLAIERKAQGSYYWINEALKSLDEQIKIGNQESIQYMAFAESLNLHERIALLPDTTRPIFTPEMPALCEPFVLKD